MALLPRLSGRYEDDLIEAESTGYFTGSDQVAMVNGIEGATHDAEPVAVVLVEAALPGKACCAR